MKKRILSLLLALVMVLTMLPAGVLAETINDSNVFLKQSENGKCTLTSAVMMLRRRAIIDGNAQWNTVTETTLGAEAWIGGTGLRNSFSYLGMSVIGTRDFIENGDKKASLIKLLSQHPEGIEIYDTGIPHAVLLTDYDDATDTFYCADPAQGTAEGRIKLSQSWNARQRGSQDAVINNISKVWYISNKSGGGPGLVTVTLDASGGICSAQNAYVSADGLLGTLPTPTRTGYRFLGWYDAPVGGTRYTAATPITKDMTLYAQWKDMTVSGTCGSGLSWTLNEDIGTLKISGRGEMTDYSSADGLNAPWHDYAASIKAIELGGGVKNIGAYAFAQLKNLKSVSIASELKRIGAGAFYGCEKLTTVDGIEGVRVLGSECFAGCTSLSEIGVPTGCTSIGAGAFKGTAIKTVSVPASVTTLGEAAFSGCTKLSYAELPAGLAKIPADCFSGCTALQAVIVVDDHSYGGKRMVIESGAFSGCTSLREIVIYNRADSLYIAKNAFADCTGIKSVSLDCLSLVLDNGAFPAGANIDYINISGEYGSVAPKAFTDVTATIVYPANGTQWGQYKDSQFGGTLTWESYDNHVHDFKTTVVAPSCGEQGYTLYECRGCTESFKGNFSAALGHDFKNGVCSVCGRNNPFTDVDSKGKDIYYTEGILWASERGITSGTSDTTFSPNGICSRAQVVTFLWRMAGKPAPISTESVFTDVQPGAYYTEAVLWASENGITSGVDATHFNPDDTVDRSQFVTMLWRYLDKPATGIDNPFSDVSSTDYFCSAVLWAYENGVATGTSDTTFSPLSIATRAQVVTFLYRASKL